MNGWKRSDTRKENWYLFRFLCRRRPLLTLLFEKSGAGDVHLDAIELADIGIKPPPLVNYAEPGGSERFLSAVIVGEGIEVNAVE